MEDVMVEMNDIAIEPEVVDEATESFEFDGQKGLAIAGGAAAAALLGFAVAKLVKANKDGKFDKVKAAMPWSEEKKEARRKKKAAKDDIVIEAVVIDDESEKNEK